MLRRLSWQMVAPRVEMELPPVAVAPEVLAERPVRAMRVVFLQVAAVLPASERRVVPAAAAPAVAVPAAMRSAIPQEPARQSVAGTAVRVEPHKERVMSA